MNYAQNAQNLASLGRGNDSMLVHMTPREVSGLQALAMARGGSLSINPNTGLPEAGFLDSILPTVLGVGASFLFPAAAPWMIGAGIGGAEALRTGDIGKGLLAGLGAFGGAGLGSAYQLASAAPATVAPGTVVGAPGAIGGVPGSTGLTATTSGANTLAGADLYGAASGGAGGISGTTSSLASTSPFTTTAGQTGLTSLTQPSTVGPSFMQAVGGKAGLAGYGAAAAAPLLLQPPEPVQFPTVEGETSKYEGPYVPAPRKVQFPTNRPLSDTSEFQYFDVVNPAPGFMRMEDQVKTAARGGLMDIPRVGMNRPDVMDTEREYAVGGLTALARGRFLQGPGDGTSDSIPASIEGKQEARLADGEFVVDARTVSELGNGSSKAGAKKLYAMMDRVHAARKKAKRGKDSNAERFMPA